MNQFLFLFCWLKRAVVLFSRSRVARICAVLALLVPAFQSALGFGLIGTKETFQADNLGYERLNSIQYPGYIWEVAEPDYTYAPHNIGEQYRLSIPTVYYAYDPTFVSYFGSNGMAAVDGAVAIVNDAFSTNMSAYSPDLSEVPLSEARVNYSANSLNLFDLKSAALEMLMPRLGLADPERFTFCIQSRILEAGSQCPFYTFTVIQRNWDPVTTAPSKYVNGNLFTYNWLQFCPPDVFGEWSSTFPVLVDPLDQYETAVASPKITFPQVGYYGWFHTGLTRDDVGALRYLYSTNSLQAEQAPPDTQLFSTNNATQLQFTSNLTAFAAQALTNNAATMETLFPGLVIISSTNTWKNVFTTNLTPYFTNSPYQPANFPPTLLRFTTNITEAIVPQFDHTYANLETVVFTNGAWRAEPIFNLNQFKGNKAITLQTTTVSIAQSPYGPADLFQITSNTTSMSYVVRKVVGEYFIQPTNQCGVDVAQLQATFFTPVTNVLLSATNTTTLTNVIGANVPLSVTANQIETDITHAFVVYPINCETSSIALRQGFDKISFVRHDFDSLLNRFFTPITNTYTRVAVTNNSYYSEFYQRVVTRPDITFAAAPILDAPLVQAVDHGQGTLNFNASAAFPGAAGPGTIEGPTTITFNDSGPILLNAITPTGFFVTEQTAVFYFQWASFDGSTNAPFLYGGNTQPSLNNLLTIQIKPPFIPAATLFVPYTTTLSVTGGTPPYTWSVSGGTSLPTGLGLAPNAPDGSTELITGNPQNQGSFSFFIQVTDAGGRSVNAAYAMTVNQ